jgi:hypothetical protein
MTPNTFARFAGELEALRDLRESRKAMLTDALVEEVWQATRRLPRHIEDGVPYYRDGRVVIYEDGQVAYESAAEMSRQTYPHGHLRGILCERVTRPGTRKTLHRFIAECLGAFSARENQIHGWD